MLNSKPLAFLTNKYILFILLIISWLLLPPKSYAAFIIAQFNTRNTNIPGNTTYKMFCDKNGYVWVITNDGVAKFNGRSFDHIKLPSEDKEFVSIFLYQNKAFLFNLTNTNCIIDLENQTLIKPWFNTHIEFNGSFISTAAVLKDTLYLSADISTKKIVYKSKTKNYTILSPNSLWNELKKHFHTSTDFPSADEVKENSAKRIFGFQFLNNAIIYENTIYNIEQDTIKTFFNGSKFGLKGTIMGYARHNEDLYVAYHEKYGVVRLKNYFISTNQSKVEVEYTLQSERINHMIKDQQNNLWISIPNKGITLIPLTLIEYKHYSLNIKAEPLYQAKISDNKTLVTFNDGSIYTRQDSTFQFWLTNKDAPDKGCLGVAQGKKIWTFFYPSGFTTFLAKNGIPYLKSIETTAALPVKDFWQQDNRYLIAARRRFFSINQEGTIDSSYWSGINIYSIAILPNQQIAKATLNGILVDQTYINASIGYKYNLLRVYNNLLVACHANGIHFFKNNELVCSISSKEGLFPAPYTDIKIDKDKLYVLSKDGISIIDGKKMVVISRFATKEFITPFEINSFYIDSNKIHLTTNNGLFELNCDYLLQKRDNPIELCMLNKDSIYTPIKQHIQLPYNTTLNQEFRVDILGLGIAKPSIQYEVLKDNKSHFKITSLLSNTIQLGNLKPGNYILKLHISNGITEHIKLYNIEILPLWYQTAIFQTFIILIALTLTGWLLLLIYKRRVSKIQENYSVKTRIIELQAQALFAQMKPHFIFNALNPLQSFILKNKKEEALNYLERFAKLTRNLLNQSRDTYTTIKQELDFLKQYIDISQTRFSNNFNCNIHLDNNINTNWKIPTMLIQPLVENAIEHGIKQKADGNIAVSMSSDLALKAITVKIEDNGAGLQVNNHIWKPNHALTIIKERMQILKNETGIGSFAIQSEPNAGFSVTLTIPINRPE